MARSEIAGDFRRMDLAAMTAARLLAEAAAGGLAVAAEGDRLVVRGPRSAEHDLVQALLARKADLMPLLTAFTPDERELFEERAAIAEADGGLGRQEAERLARQEVEAMRRASGSACGPSRPVGYLASPYSHPDPAVRESRYRAACAAAAALLRAGELVVSPVAHSHPLAGHGLPEGWAFGGALDRALLSRCDEVVVLTLEGWQDSEGVRAEVELARALGKPVRYVAAGLAGVPPTVAQVASPPPG